MLGLHQLVEVAEQERAQAEVGLVLVGELVLEVPAERFRPASALACLEGTSRS